MRLFHTTFFSLEKDIGSITSGTDDEPSVEQL